MLRSIPQFGSSVFQVLLIKGLYAARRSDRIPEGNVLQVKPRCGSTRRPIATCSCAQVLQDDPKMQAVAEAPLPQLVQPADCPSCEQEFLARSREFEAEELVPAGAS